VTTHRSALCTVLILHSIQTMAKRELLLALLPFWCGSGSADPCLDYWIRIRILDPDPAIFVIDLQDARKKLLFKHHFFCLLLFGGTFTSFFKEKSQKESQNSRNQGFSHYFCMMIEGSGSGRPKNMWIRWIRIRIRNTGYW
jgi:hypothetical protein